MELIMFILFAWFLFIVGKYFKDFAITFISGALILMAGVLSFTTVMDNTDYAFAIVNLCIGLYIMFRSLVELIEINFRGFKLKWGFKKKNGTETSKSKARRS